MKAGAMKDTAHAVKLTSDAQGVPSEVDMVKMQVDLAEKLARIEKIKVDSENVRSETMRNGPEMQHLQSETLLNIAKARQA